MITENKKDTRASRLVGDTRIARKLLKKNGEAKFCPFCGEPMTNNCACHKNIVVDIKPNKSNPEKTVFIFQNLDSFKTDLEELTVEMKTKDNTKKEPVEADLD